jgi:hypothetical protein
MNEQIVESMMSSEEEEGNDNSMRLEFPESILGFFRFAATNKAVVADTNDDPAVAAAEPSIEEEAAAAVTTDSSSLEAQLEKEQKENQHAQDTLQNMQSQWQFEKTQMQQAHQQQLDEARQWYREELQQTRSSQQVELNAAMQQAADAWQANRKVAQEYEERVRAIKEDFQAKLEAWEQSYGPEAWEKLQRQNHDTLLHMATWMQHEYDKVETELLEALNQIDDMEEEIFEERMKVAKAEMERDEALMRVKQLEEEIHCQEVSLKKQQEIETIVARERNSWEKENHFKSVSNQNVSVGSDDFKHGITEQKITMNSPSGRRVNSLHSPTSAFRAVTSTSSQTPNPNHAMSGSKSQVHDNNVFFKPVTADKENNAPALFESTDPAAVKAVDLVSSSSAKPSRLFQPTVSSAKKKSSALDAQSSVPTPSTTANKMPAASASRPSRLAPPARSSLLSKPASRVTGVKKGLEGSTSATKIARPESAIREPRQKSLLSNYGQSRTNCKSSIKGPLQKSGLTQPTRVSGLNRPGNMVKPASRVQSDKRALKTPGSSRPKETPCKSSPSEIIKAVLDCLPSSEKKTTAQSVRAPSPSCFPETIEEMPKEVQSEVGEKFDSLFTSWTTAKKSRHAPGTHNDLMDGDNPVQLFSGWSTAKKTKRVEPVGIPDMSLTANKRIKTFLAQQTPSRAYQNDLSLPCDTPLFVRDEIVDVFSPEELLLSPCPVNETKMATPSKSESSAPSEEESMLDNTGASDDADKRRAAATKVQACLRGYAYRMKFQHMKSQVVVVQRKYRVLSAVRQRKKLLTSVARIQTMARGRMAMQGYRRMCIAIVKLQKLHRGVLARKEFKNMVCEALSYQQSVREHAIIRLQAFVRTRTQQRRYKQARDLGILKETSSIKIQSAIRGISARRQYQQLTALRAQEVKDICCNAAVSIQRVAKGWIVRKEYAALCRSIEQQMQLKRHTASIIVQRIARGVAARRMRATLASERFMFQQRHSSAVVIQRIYRGAMARRINKMLVAERDELLKIAQDAAAIVIQCLFRRLLARRLHASLVSDRVAMMQHRHTSAVVIQRVHRGAMARQLRKVLRAERDELLKIAHETAATVLQRLARGHLARRLRGTLETERAAKMHNHHISVVVIQRVYRGAMARRLYAMLSAERNETLKIAQHAAATSMQCLLRGLLARRLAMKELNAVVTIQKYMRMFAARACLKQKVQAHSASVVIQSAIRTFHARRNYTEVSKAVMRVQALARGHKDRNLCKSLKRSFSKRVEQESTTKSIEENDPVSCKKTPKQSSRPQKSARKPLGNAASEGNTPPRQAFPTRQTRHKNFTSLNDEENCQNAPPSTPAEVKTTPSIKIVTASAPQYDYSKLEDFKVVELRDLLIAHGVEKKDVRNVRKAELKKMVVDLGCPIPT